MVSTLGGVDTTDGCTIEVGTVVGESLVSHRLCCYMCWWTMRLCYIRYDVWCNNWLVNSLGVRLSTPLEFCDVNVRFIVVTVPLGELDFHDLVSGSVKNAFQSSNNELK